MRRPLLELVQSANREFPRFLALASTMADGPQSPSEVQKLAKRLQQIGEHLVASQACVTQDETTQAALAEYRKNLETLLPVLQSARCALLIRRAQLQVEESHLRAACSWAISYRNTL